MDNKMIKNKGWGEFRRTGLFLLINQLLHAFGWAIVFVVDRDDKIIEVYPARVKYRGFSEKDTENSYIKIAKYMDENSKDLLDEIKD